ncbi:MAG: hypothetical protein HGA23_09540, partial [Bacteroidales bacterium]|nr:hypothetical protein [Bacteroidales bacterium]
MGQAFNLNWIDYSIILTYFIFVLGIGWVLKKYMRNASAFLEAGRSLPAWVTGLAFISANLGAIQLNYGCGADECKRVVEMGGADALILQFPLWWFAMPAILTVSTRVQFGARAFNDTGQPAALACWIDFNQNGVFTDPGERQAAPVSSAPAVQTIE